MILTKSADTEHFLLTFCNNDIELQPFNFIRLFSAVLHKKNFPEKTVYATQLQRDVHVRLVNTDHFIIFLRQ